MARVLVTDDNAAFAENLAEILTDAGHEVTVAMDGEQALRHVQTTRFDVMLSDMRMPAMGGAELVHRVRRCDPGLPAIVITAFTHDNELALARQEGLLAVMPKPLPIPSLLALITRARRQGLVALIEDDNKLCDNLTEVLREHGFATVTAASVLETSRLGDVSPFVALVDLRVPGGPDGEAMRTLETRFPGIPVVIMTAHPAPSLDGRRDLVFMKPFSTALLLHQVEQIYWQQRNRHA